MAVPLKCVDSTVVEDKVLRRCHSFPPQRERVRFNAAKRNELEIKFLRRLSIE